MKKAWKRVAFVVKFWRFLPFIKDFYLTPDVAFKHKAGPIALIIGYILLPVDIIPDIFSLVGFTDDLLFTTFILQRIVKTSPPWLKDKYDVNGKKII